MQKTEAYAEEGLKMEQIQLTKSEKISINTTEISKRIRQQLQKEFPSCKFSVRSEYYSMGSSITVSLMKANFKVIMDFKGISEMAIFDYTQGRSKEQLQEGQKENYHQLNPYASREEFNPDVWNNGVFLTKQGHELFKRVVEIADQYNYNDSDSQSDYYSVNFSFSLEIGKCDKDFERGV